MNNDSDNSGLPDGLDLRALSAFVDGELPGEQRAEIEALLEGHPEAAARVAAWRAQKAALRALCGADGGTMRKGLGTRLERGMGDEHHERRDLSERDEHHERRDISERDGHHERREKAERDERAGRIDRAERDEDDKRAEWPEREDRHERDGRPEPYAHHERTDTTDTTEPAFIVVRRSPPWWQRVGLAACWLVVGAGLGLALGPLAPRLTGGAWGGLTGQPPSFAQRADIAYAVYTPERRHPVEVAASEEEHLVSWLSKRLNRPLSVPSLQEYGYSLVGGRLLPGEAGPAAQFMYENGSGARLTLYVTGTARDQTAFRLLRDGSRRTFYWINDGMGYALSGQIAEGKLRSIAIDVCSALGGKPEAWQ